MSGRNKRSKGKKGFGQPINIRPGERSQASPRRNTRSARLNLFSFSSSSSSPSWTDYFFHLYRHPLPEKGFKRRSVELRPPFPLSAFLPSSSPPLPSSLLGKPLIFSRYGGSSGALHPPGAGCSAETPPSLPHPPPFRPPAPSVPPSLLPPPSFLFPASLFRPSALRSVSSRRPPQQKWPRDAPNGFEARLLRFPPTIASFRAPQGLRVVSSQTEAAFPPLPIFLPPRLIIFLGGAMRPKGGCGRKAPWGSLQRNSSQSQKEKPCLPLKTLS